MPNLILNSKEVEDELFSQLVDQSTYVSLDYILSKYQLPYDQAQKIMHGLLNEITESLMYCDKFCGIVSKTLIVQDDHSKIAKATMSLQKVAVQNVNIEDILLALVPNEFNERDYYLIMPLEDSSNVNSNIDFICSRMVFPLNNSKNNHNNGGGGCRKNVTGATTPTTTSTTPTPTNSIRINTPKSLPIYKPSSSSKIISDDVNANETWVQEVISELTNTTKTNTPNKRNIPSNSEEPLPPKLLKTSSNKAISSSKPSNKTKSKPKQPTMSSFFGKK